MLLNLPQHIIFVVLEAGGGEMQLKAE
jgi:hypothetical protein